MLNKTCELEVIEQFYEYRYTVISLYIPIALLALTANVMVIVVVVKFQWMRNITNYFLVNLSVADLLVTILCMPNGALTAYTMLWHFDRLTCKLRNYLQCVSVASSVFTITCMAVDRYLAITQPFGFCRWFTKKSTIVIIIMMWIFSLIFFSPMVIVTDLMFEGVSTSCDGNDTNVTITFCNENNWEIIADYLPRSVFGIASFAIMFAIPGAVILWAYAMMGRKLCSVRPPFDENNSISSQQSSRLVRERKRVAWILLTLVLIFAICWLPYNTIGLLIDYGFFENNTDTSLYLQYALLLGHANSALNPIIYCIMSKNFRNSVKQLLCCSRVDYDISKNHKLQVKWADNSGSSQRLCLQRNKSGPLVHMHVHMTLSQKTTKTCAV